MSTMGHEHCDSCACELEAGQIGLCDDCIDLRDGPSEAAHAEEAMNRFINTTGVSRSDALADMLESLMHWSEKNGFDFDTELDRANNNFSN